MYFLKVKNYNGQYGFRKETLNYNSNIRNDWSTTMNNSWSSIALFTYLKNKAFNIVDNSMLLQKLEHHALEL